MKVLKQIKIPHQNFWHSIRKEMQQNSELLNETKNTNKPAFVQTDVLRTHTGVVKWFKFKARNENAVNTK